MGTSKASARPLSSRARARWHPLRSHHASWESQISCAPGVYITRLTGAWPRSMPPLSSSDHSAGQQLLRRTCAQLGATFVGTLSLRHRDTTYGGSTRNDTSFKDMLTAIEQHEYEPGPSKLRDARDLVALLMGMHSTLGHVEMSFQAGHRPDFSTLHTWFTDELADAKAEVKRLEAAGPVAGPSTPSAAGPSSPGPGAPHSSSAPADFSAVFDQMLDELEQDEYEPSDLGLREAAEQVTLVKGLQDTLTKLLSTHGGPKGDMDVLRRGLEQLRAHAQAEADRIRADRAAAGGGGGGPSVADLVELRKLQKDVDQAADRVKNAKDAYEPVKHMGTTNRGKKRAIRELEEAELALTQAEKALDDFKRSIGMTT